ncbi:MAG: NAD(P)/FAD-dependent oxidoreductase [Bacteroidales bacterium]|jgi:hypothetical protein|nr:NAD(P)/FAD-dependent oxidoreductase [Bacteroidales bacterium]MDD4213941.1 NAD(P)/FAD-dependent oxidoreductase [Bacteroidales bacterium]
MNYDVIIIGAGASGLMCAGTAASRGLHVMLLEKMPMPARKLRISGKGRCNITNIAPQSEFMKHIGPDTRFLKYAFATFFSKELIHFFESIGVPTITEQGGRVFPASESAQDVVDALVKWAKKQGIEMICKEPVSCITVNDNKATGIILANGKHIPAKKVVLATGGASYPATGSEGDGYRMAKELGHTIKPVYPALVPFETDSDIPKRLQGLSLKNVQAHIWVEGRKTASAFGEMLFTHFGVSGPIILSLSRKIQPGEIKQKNVEISIDLKPALDHEKLDARLLRDMDEHGKKSFNSLLKLWLPSSMIPVFADSTGIPLEKTGNQISSAERKKIRLLLKDFRLRIIRTRGFAEAIITAGGVSTSEINPVTMESKLIKNLFFCGEVIDLDADTGGYNLQIAFSTGYLAGISMQKS